MAGFMDDFFNSDKPTSVFGLPERTWGDRFNNPMTQLGLTLMQNHGRPTRQAGPLDGLATNLNNAQKYQAYQDEKAQEAALLEQQKAAAGAEKQALVDYALSVVPDNLKSMAMVQPEAAIKYAQQQNPNIKPMEINGQLVDPNSYEVLGDYRDAPTQKSPVVREITLEDGSEVAIQWNPETGVWDPLNAPMGGGTANPKNKLTEAQSKYALFGRMQKETAPVLDSLEQQFNPANTQDAMARSMPIAGNFFQSEQGQIYNTAAAAWSEGALRIATGAAATQPEIERTQSTYFAQPGDTPNTIHFKSEMRKMYSRALLAASGAQGVEGALPDPMEFAQSFALQNQTGSGSDTFTQVDGVLIRPKN